MGRILSKIFRKTKELDELGLQNRLVLRGYAVILVIIEIAYVLEVLKGNYDWAYMGIFSVLVFVPFAMMCFFYYRDAENTINKYIMSFGWIIFYIFALLTAQTALAFVYFIPPFILIISYEDRRLACIYSLLVAFSNFLEIVVFYSRTAFSEADIVDAEIQIVVVILMGIYLIAVVQLLARLTQNKVDEIAEKQYQAEASNRSKSEFLSNMSHEIRTPLNAIIGMNEMILREADDPVLFSYAQSAQSSSTGLLNLINDILDTSKMDAGKFELVEDVYAVSSVYVDCYNMIAERAKEKNIDLQFVCDPNIPTELYGDMLRVRQIFSNILSNAVKFTEVGYVKISLMSKREGDICHLTFICEDSGVGMSEDDLKRLYEKFERFDMQSNRTVEGAGLGMNIAKRLLDMMGGTISAESRLGYGTVFNVELPQRIINDKPLGKVDVVEEANRFLNAAKETFVAPDAEILVVDDVESNIKVFRNVLKPTMMKVTSAHSGKEAIAIACEKKFNVIFLDHMMPGMDGIETLHNLKANPENKNPETPVVMLTANALAGEREKYFEAGFSDYLTKPIHVQDLHASLLRHLPSNLIGDE